jgi:hypothetical protein
MQLFRGRWRERMPQRLRWLAVLAAAGWLMGCKPAAQVDVAGAQDGVLPATESHQDFGNYVVYFNALNTDQLTPEIASEYGIVRSKSRAMLNVSIHRKEADGKTVAVTGTVTASAINLTGQLKNMTLREIKEGDAIFYIGELAVTDGEVLVYTIDVMPSNESSHFTIRFKKQFFVDK